MILIDNKEINDPVINLALEEYCVRNLDFRDENYLLFYINQPSIIIGKHQNTIEEINSKYVEENNIIVVRRISGGGAVYHDLGNLNFSFLTKHSDNSINNFKLFTQPVTETLNMLGINAELSGRNDITVEGRKVSGNAQFTNTKAMFSHGTLLFDSQIENVVEALNVKIDKIQSKGIKSVRSRVANISEFLSEKMTVIQFRQKLVDNIFKNYETVPILRLSDIQWDEVMKLSESKYRTWEWNYGRSPEFNIRKTQRFDFGQIDARISVKNGIIEEINFYGDFLGCGETSEVGSLLKGVRYEKNQIGELLQNNIDLKYYFGDISGEDFVKFLTE